MSRPIDFEQIETLLQQSDGLGYISIPRDQLVLLVIYAKGNYVGMHVAMNTTVIIGTEESRLETVNGAHDIAHDMIKIISEIAERSAGETTLTAAVESLGKLKRQIEKAQTP